MSAWEKYEPALIALAEKLWQEEERRGNKCDLEDVIQEARIGAWEAETAFDTTKGKNILAYMLLRARWRIRDKCFRPWRRWRKHEVMSIDEFIRSENAGSDGETE